MKPLFLLVLVPLLLPPFNPLVPSTTRLLPNRSTASWKLGSTPCAFVGQREKVLLSQQRSMSNWWITA